MRVELRAEGATQQAQLADEVLAPGHAARDEVAVAADVLGQRIHRQVDALADRVLEDRTQHRVVARRDRPVAMLALECVDRRHHGLQIDQSVGRVGRRFQVEQPDAPARRSRFERGRHLFRRQAIGEGMSADAPLGQDLADQRFGAAIQRRRVHDLVAGPQEGQQHGADRRHAARGHDRVFGAVEQRQAILDDLQVRVIEAAVDEARSGVRGAGACDPQPRRRTPRRLPPCGMRRSTSGTPAA